MKQKLEYFLAEHWLFKALDNQELSNISQKFSTRTYEKGQFVFHQQDLADRVYVILSGLISIETLSPDGQVTKIAQLGPGEVFGELALIEDCSRTASAYVVTSATLASLTKSTFTSLLKANFEVSKRILSVLSSRLRDTTRKVESLVTLSVLQRTVQVLLQMSVHDGDFISITQKDLSERLFASREKVNGKLKVLERDGAIKLLHGKIHVLSRDKLKRFWEPSA